MFRNNRRLVGRKSPRELGSPTAADHVAGNEDADFSGKTSGVNDMHTSPHAL